MTNLPAYTLLAVGAIEGAISGAVLSGNLSGAWQGAASGAIFSSIGSIAQVQGIADGSIRKVAMSGVGGGVSSVISGGKFQSGFLAAGFSEFAGPHIEKLPLKSVGGVTSRIIGGVARGAVGGTASVLGGGKFANGAITSSFQYLFNFLDHAEYFLESQELTVRDGETQASGKFKIATEGGKRVKPGEYDILQGTDGRYRLERRGDTLYGDDVDGSTNQAYIRLHGPGRSFGCVTACSQEDWNKINSVISNTVPLHKNVFSYRDPLAYVGLGAYSSGAMRQEIGTEELKWYGTLTVRE